MIAEQYCACVDDTQGHIQAGDIFQLVSSQRVCVKLMVRGNHQSVLCTWHFGLTSEEERNLEEDHVAHEKEYAEHVMFVDLESSEQNFCGHGRGMRRL